MKLPSGLNIAIAGLALEVARPFIERALADPSFISATQLAWALRLEPGCILAGVDVK